jgi:hypothetical protein
MEQAFFESRKTKNVDDRKEERNSEFLCLSRSTLQTHRLIDLELFEPMTIVDISF